MIRGLAATNSIIASKISQEHLCFAKGNQLRNSLQKLRLHPLLRPSPLLSSLIHLPHYALFETKLDKESKNLKKYEKLFLSQPISQTNSKLTFMLNEINTKFAVIMMKRCSSDAFKILNSIQIVTDYLYQNIHQRIFIKCIPYLSNSMAIIMKEIEIEKNNQKNQNRLNQSEKIQLQQLEQHQQLSPISGSKMDVIQYCGVMKRQTVKKLITVIRQMECIYGQDFVQFVCGFLITTIQQSEKYKVRFAQTHRVITQQMQRLNSLIKEQKQKPSQSQERQNLQRLLLQQKLKMKRLKLKLIYLQEQDLLCALHYLLEKGYYTKTIVSLIDKEVLSQQSYLPTVKKLQAEEKFMMDDKQPFYQITHNRQAIYKAKLFNSLAYRLKILNLLKKIKIETGVSLYGGGVRGEENSDTKGNRKQSIEKSIISQNQYRQILASYMDCLTKESTYLALIKEPLTSQFVKMLLVQFYSWIYQDPHHRGQQSFSHKDLTHDFIKKSYMTLFCELYDYKKNGNIFTQSKQTLPFGTQTIFQTVLMLYTYEDRHLVFELLANYEQFYILEDVQSSSLISEQNEDRVNLYNLKKTMGMFNTCVKFGYRSNFLAQKFLKMNNMFQKPFIASHQQLTQLCIYECKNLKIYFELLENPPVQLLGKLDKHKKNSTTLSKQKSQASQAQSTTQPLSYSKNNFINNLVQMYFIRYNKIILYLQDNLNSNHLLENTLEMTYLNLIKKKEIPDCSTKNIRHIKKDYPEIFKSLQQRITNVYSKVLGRQIQKDRQIKKQHRNKKNKNSQEPFISESDKNIDKQSIFIRSNYQQSVLQQTRTILQILQTAFFFNKEKEKEINFLEDAVKLFKQIFSPSLSSIIKQNIAYPQLLKTMIRVSELFRSQQDPKANALFEKLLQVSTKKTNSFDLQSFFYNSRLEYSKCFNKIREQQLNNNKNNSKDKQRNEHSFLPYLTNLERNLVDHTRFQTYTHSLAQPIQYQKNVRVWNVLDLQAPYALNYNPQQTAAVQTSKSKIASSPKKPIPKKIESTTVIHSNVVFSLSFDILHLVLQRNIQKYYYILQSVLSRYKEIRLKDQRGNTYLKVIKYQLNYLEYPYLAHLALNRDKQPTIFLIRNKQYVSSSSNANIKASADVNNVFKKYELECEQYFKKKYKNTVIVQDQSEIRKQLIKLLN